MAETKDKSAGLVQPESQNPEQKEESTDVHVPAAIRGHKAVPAGPHGGLVNTESKFDVSTKPKTMEQCVSDHKARTTKK